MNSTASISSSIAGENQSRVKFQQRDAGLVRTWSSSTRQPRSVLHDRRTLDEVPRRPHARASSASRPRSRRRSASTTAGGARTTTSTVDVPDPLRHRLDRFCETRSRSTTRSCCEYSRTRDFAPGRPRPSSGAAGTARRGRDTRSRPTASRSNLRAGSSRSPFRG